MVALDGRMKIPRHWVRLGSVVVTLATLVMASTGRGHKTRERLIMKTTLPPRAGSVG
jgi:hypothetical protein